MAERTHYDLVVRKLENEDFTAIIGRRSEALKGVAPQQDVHLAIGGVVVAVGGDGVGEELGRQWWVGAEKGEAIIEVQS